MSCLDHEAQEKVLSILGIQEEQHYQKNDRLPEDMALLLDELTRTNSKKVQPNDPC